MADPVPLTPEERRRLLAILSGLYDFVEGPHTRRVFLQEIARLGRFVPGLNLSGASRTVAAELVGRLEVYGFLPERPAYHALGALLNAVLELGDLPRPEAAFLAGLILRYGLVDDPAYQDGLEAEYGLQGVRRTSRSGEAAHPPLAREAPGPGPGFSAAVGDAAALEQVIHSDDNFLDLHLLAGALYCSMAVCRIEMPEGRAQGTGFLVNRSLLITNQHVLNDREMLAEAVARFGYLVDASGVAERGLVVRFDPGFYEASPPEELDFALARLEEEPLGDKLATAEQAGLAMIDLFRAGRHRGYLPLAGRTIRRNDRLNILQHPEGDPMKVVLTQNHVLADMNPRRVQYVADTKDGSSGSPVFNQAWEVVALHHSGSPYPPDSPAQAARKVWKGLFRANEGIPARALLEDFKARGLLRHLPRT